MILFVGKNFTACSSDQSSTSRRNYEVTGYDTWSKNNCWSTSWSSS